MIKIVAPTSDDIRTIQSEEGAFYWSACAENLLRKHGLGPVGSVDDGRPGCTVLLRKTPFAPEAQPLLVEGPMTATVAASMNIRTRDAKGKQLKILDASDKPIAEALYPALQVRRIPDSRDELSEPYVYEAEDPRWTQRDLRLQFLDGGEEWTAIAWGRLDDQETEPIALTDGSRIVIGAPLFDVAAFTQMVPPLDVGWYTRVRGFDVFALERWLIGLLTDLCERHRVPITRAPLWPDGKRAAFTIRHDYDRPVSDEALSETLDFYGHAGTKATWFLLVDSAPPADQIRAMVDGGHEVALHTVARTPLGFRDECRRFAEMAGRNPAGYSSHGGIGSAGYLGLTQNTWAEAEGMIYGELLGAFAGLPHLVHKVVCDVPAVGSLVIPNTHRSLDQGTKPDAHFLDRLLQRLPADLQAGRHVVTMNHPDIHWPELRTLLERLDLTDAWPATMEEVAVWSARRMNA